MSDDVEIPQVPGTATPDYEMKVKNYRAYRLVYFILGLLEVILALRFVFKLLGANPANIFAILVYGVSGLLLLPFRGLFSGAAIVADVTARVIEPSTIIAMIVYALLAWGVAKWILIFKSKPLSKS